MVNGQWSINHFAQSALTINHYLSIDYTAPSPKAVFAVWV